MFRKRARIRIADYYSVVNGNALDSKVRIDCQQIFPLVGTFAQLSGQSLQ